MAQAQQPRAGLRWTKDAADKAAKEHMYVFVGGNQLGSRSLSGAKQKWSSDDEKINQVIYNPTNRISGLPDDVGTALMGAGFTQQQAVDAVRSSYNRSNIMENSQYFDPTAKASFDREIAEYLAFKASKPEVQPKEWSEIAWYAVNIHTATIEGGSRSGQKVAGKGSGGSTRGSAKDTLPQKLEKLTKSGSQKVLDVTDIDAGGFGATPVAIPKTDKGTKGAKFGIMGIPMVSKNFDKLRYAIGLVYGPDYVNQRAADLATLQRYINYRNSPPEANVPFPEINPNVYPQLSAQNKKISSGGAIQLLQPIPPQAFGVPGGFQQQNTFQPAPVFQQGQQQNTFQQQTFQPIPQQQQQNTFQAAPQGNVLTMLQGVGSPTTVQPAQLPRA